MQGAITPLSYTSSWPATCYSTPNLHYTIVDDHLLGCDGVNSFTLTMKVAESVETSVTYQPSERHHNHEVSNGYLNTNSVK
jgi:hypothetical protein